MFQPLLLYFAAKNLVMILLLALSAEPYGFSRTRVKIEKKKSTTSATDGYNMLNHSTLWVHFDFLKMLLEMLPVGVSSQLHI